MSTWKTYLWIFDNGSIEFLIDETEYTYDADTKRHYAETDNVKKRIKHTLFDIKLLEVKSKVKAFL